MLIVSGLQTAKKLVATLGKVVRSLIINDPVADIKKPGPGTGQSTIGARRMRNVFDRSRDFSNRIRRDLLSSSITRV